MNKVLQKVYASIIQSLPKSFKTVWWLIKIILPISLLVAFLQYLGVIAWLAGFMSPVFGFVGLPGESAIVFISSIFLALYAPVAIISTLSLDMREITILAIMCLISHNMIVESAIQRKTGSSAVVMFVLRIAMSFLMAFIFNKILPDDMGSVFSHNQQLVFANLYEMLLNWLQGIGWLTLKMTLIITGLMILQNILKEFNVLTYISRFFSPLMRLFGLSKSSSFLWFVAQTLGLTYGSVVMIEAVNKQEISASDANLLNHHIAVNHSLLEDTLIFVTIGVSALWITIPRIILATFVVWVVKLISLNKHVSQPAKK